MSSGAARFHSRLLPKLGLTALQHSDRCIDRIQQSQSVTYLNDSEVSFEFRFPLFTNDNDNAAAGVNATDTFCSTGDIGLSIVDVVGATVASAVGVANTHYDSGVTESCAANASKAATPKAANISSGSGSGSGAGVGVGTIRMYGSPWQPEFCDWAFNQTRGPASVDK